MITLNMNSVMNPKHQPKTEGMDMFKNILNNSITNESFNTLKKNK